jgi:hypothetical protein
MALQLYIALLQYTDDVASRYTFVGPFDTNTAACDWGASHTNSAEDWQCVRIDLSQPRVLSVEEADKLYPRDDVVQAAD